MKRDYYEILGIDKHADAQAIKKAFRKLAKKYHPNCNEGNAQAAERFKEVNEAYDVLGDEEKRKLYDRFGHAAFDASAGEYQGARDSGFQGGFQGGFRNGFQGGFQNGFQGGFQNGFRSGSYTRPGGGFQEYHFEGGEDMDDILKSLFGHDSNRKGSDLKAEIEISFDKAAFGGKERVQLQGSGLEMTVLEVNIPAGIASGKTIRLKGRGNPGTQGAEPGDLLLTVRVKDKPGFRREGQDVYTTVRIPFTTAVLGGEATIPTLYGDVVCKIKEDTQPGSKIRLKGKGIVSMGNPSVYGDQYVTVEIRAPKKLTEEAKQKLRELSGILAA